VTFFSRREDNYQKRNNGGERAFSPKRTNFNRNLFRAPEGSRPLGKKSLREGNEQPKRTFAKHYLLHHKKKGKNTARSCKRRMKYQTTERRFMKRRTED